MRHPIRWTRFTPATGGTRPRTPATTATISPAAPARITMRATRTTRTARARRSYRTRWIRRAASRLQATVTGYATMAASAAEARRTRSSPGGCVAGSHDATGPAFRSRIATAAPLRARSMMKRTETVNTDVAVLTAPRATMNSRRDSGDASSPRPRDRSWASAVAAPELSAGSHDTRAPATDPDRIPRMRRRGGTFALADRSWGGTTDR